MNGVDAERVLARLQGRQRDIVLAISIEARARGRWQAPRHDEGVRVALHRALQSLAGVSSSAMETDELIGAIVRTVPCAGLRWPPA
jgi:hypothetical protein